MTTAREHWSWRRADLSDGQRELIRACEARGGQVREIGGGKLRIEMARGRPTHGTGLGADITPVRPTPRRPWWWVPWALVLAGVVAVVGPLVWGRP